MTREEALDRAREHQDKARLLTSESARLAVQATIHMRWARRWQDWAADPENVAYPAPTSDGAPA
jgi:hypothetical protein